MRRQTNGRKEKLTRGKRRKGKDERKGEGKRKRERERGERQEVFPVNPLSFGRSSSPSDDPPVSRSITVRARDGLQVIERAALRSYRPGARLISSGARHLVGRSPITSIKAASQLIS